MFMLCTDVKTQFSSDKVINCFIISSAYISGRLLGGGQNVSNEMFIIKKNIPLVGDIEVVGFKPTGPLLNPAISFGQYLIRFDF